MGLLTKHIFIIAGLVALLTACQDSTSDPVASTRDGGRGIVLTPPDDLTLVSPLATPSHISTPTIEVTGTKSGEIIRLYRGPNCSHQVGSRQASGSSVTITTSPLPAGESKIYAATSDSIGNLSACTDSSVTYTWSADRVELVITGEDEILANEIASTTLVATARDQNNKLAAGEPVTLNIPADGGSVPSTTLITNNNGQVSFTLTSSLVAGNYSYTAEVDHATSMAQNVTFIDPATLYTLDLEVSGDQNIEADGTSTTTLLATVIDGWGDPVNGHSLNLNIPTDGGSVAEANPQNTNAAGQAQWTLTSSTLAGSYNYSVDNGSDTTPNVTVNFVPGDIANLDLSLTGDSEILANGQSATSFKVIATDAFNNKVSGKQLSLVIPTDGGSTSATQLTNAQGEANWTLTSSTVADTYSYHVSDGQINSNSLQVEFQPGPIATIDFELTGNDNITADGTSTTSFKAQASDTYGNLVPQKEITLTLPNNGGSTNNPQTTDNNGEVSWTLASSTKAGNYTYRATHGQINSSTLDVTFSPGPIATIELNLDGPDEIEVGGEQTSFIALAKDTHGNVVPGEGIQLTLPTDGGDLTPNTPLTTDGQGSVQWTLSSSTVADTYSYTATDNNITSNTREVTFTAGALSSLDLSINGDDKITADSVSTTILEAQALDIYGNQVPGEEITLTIPENGGSTDNPQTTDSSGIASFTLTSSTLVGTYDYNATDGDEVTNTVQVEFEPGPVANLELTLTGNGEIGADGVSTTSFEVFAEDAYNNVVPDAEVTLNIPQDGGSDNGPRTTDLNGITDFTLTSSTVAGSYSYNVTSGAATSNDQEVVFAPGELDNIILEVTGDDSIVANAQTTTTLQAKAEDEFENPIAGQTLSLSIETDGGTVSQVNLDTDEQGLVEWTLTSSTVAGTYSFDVSGGTITSNQEEVTFTPGPIDQLILSLEGDDELEADATSTTDLKVIAMDAHDNLVPDASLTLNIPNDGGSVVTNPETTDINGEALWTLTSSTKAGSYDYKVTDGVVESNIIQVTFAPGDLASLSLNVTGDEQIVANGQSQTTLEVLAEDANDNPIEGLNLVLTIPTNGGNATNPRLTNDSGVATWTLTSSTLADEYSYQVSKDAIDSNIVAVEFIAGAPDDIILTITGDSNIVANASSTTTLQAEVLDAFSNPVKEKELILNIPNNGGSTNNPQTSDNDGIANWTLTSSLVADTYSYLVSDGSVDSNNVDITFEAGEIDSLELSITGDAEIVADAQSTTIITVVAKDLHDNIVPNKAITLNIPTDGGSVSGGNPRTTNNDGEVQWTLTSSTLPDVYSYTATHAAINSNSADITFSVGPIASLSLSINGDSTLTANGSDTTTVEAEALDAYNNPVPDANITLNIPTNGGSVIQTNPQSTDAAGQVAWTLTSSTKSGTYSYTVEGGTITSNAVELTFGPDQLASLELNVTGAASIVADGNATTTLEAQALDAHNNTISDLSLSLDIPTDGGSTINPRTTNSNGIASWTLTSGTTAGEYSYQVSKDTIDSNTVEVNFIPGDVDSIGLTITGDSSIVADGSTTTLEAEVLDANNNPIEGKELTLNIPANGGSTDNPQVSDANGIATWTLTSGTLAGNYSYIASDGTKDSNSIEVEFRPGDITQLTLSVSGTDEIVADATSTTTLDVIAEDANSNRVPDKNITLTIPTDGGSTTNPKTTNSNGEAQWTLTSSTLADTYEYTATDGSITSAAVEITFTAGDVSSLTLSIIGDSALVVDGNTTTLEAQAFDTYNNPVAQANITLDLPTDGGSVVEANPQESNSEGKTSWTLESSTKAGSYSYTASSAGESSNSVGLTFTAGPVAQVSLTLDGDATIAADETATTTLRAEVYDAHNNPIGNETVSLNVPNDGGLANPNTTDASGITLITLTSSDTPGTYEYTASADGITSVDSAFVTFETAVISWNTSFYNFGATNEAKTETFTLTNTGLMDSGTIGIDLSSMDLFKWDIITNNCEPSIVLEPQETCTVIIEYHGDTLGEGVHEATLEAEATPGGSDIIELEGETVE